ncbi:MAG: putative ABC transport system permease protein [Saprospiraceae bacterium]|jgi:putative ABC transport system permease protein
MLIKLAWRNIWRNKRRTLITAAAVAFAVFFSSFLISFQKGIWDQAVDSTVNLYFGYAQVHGFGYNDEQTIEHAIPFDEKVKDLVQEIDKIDKLIPRLESFALASEGELTTGVLVLGVDPEPEDAMTNLSSRVIEGKYLNAENKEVIVASGLAEKLGLALGDTLVLISQGYHGVNAAGKFPITGIFEFALPAFNKRLVCMPLKAAQYFYGAENMISTLVLKINDKDDVPEVISAVKSRLPKEDYEVMSWEEMIPDLLEARQVDEAGSIIIFVILYFIIGFAIFGTILMMTKEREYEFGVLTSIGLGRWKLFSIVWMELIFVGILGSLIGILISLGPVYYYHENPINMIVFGQEIVDAYEKFGMEPIMPFAFEFGIFFNQAFIIFIITSILSFYPFFIIFKLKPVEAMRG